MKKGLVFALLFGLVFFLGAQTKNLTVSSESSLKYGKTGAGMLRGDEAIVVYQATSRSSGRADIYGALVNWDRVVSLGNLSNSSSLSLEPDVAVSPNGVAHIAWFDYSGGGVYSLKYRTYSGGKLSSVRTLGQTGSIDLVEDLRIVADSSETAAIAWMNWSGGGAYCFLATNYGSHATISAFPLTGRSKHPDVAIDDANIHVTWQYRGSFTNQEYSIVYASRPNIDGGSFRTPINLDVKDGGRPRIDVDVNGYPYVAYYIDVPSGSSRNIYMEYWNGSRFTGKTLLGNPSRTEAFHYLDLEVYSANDILMTSQTGGYLGGQGVQYNWKLNGRWSGYSRFPLGGRPAHQSTDLSLSKPMAVVAWADSDDAVKVYFDQRGSAYGEAPGPGPTPPPAPVPVPNKPPVARILLSPSAGIYPLSVNFNGTASSDPDGRIVSYAWNMGDSSIDDRGQFVHVYHSPGIYKVKLVVTDNRGDKSSATAQVTVNAVQPPLDVAYNYHQNRNLFSTEHYYRLTWRNNPMNEQLGFNIVRYNVYRRLKGEEEFVHLAKVPRKDQNEFLDRSLQNTFYDYEYRVTCEDPEGRQNDLVGASESTPDAAKKEKGGIRGKILR